MTCVSGKYSVLRNELQCLGEITVPRPDNFISPDDPITAAATAPRTIGIVKCTGGTIGAFFDIFWPTFHAISFGIDAALTSQLRAILRAIARNLSSPHARPGIPEGSRAV